MELYFLIILPIFTSLLLYLLPGKVTTWLGSFLYLAVFGVTVHLFYRVRFGGEIVTTGGSPDFLGISLYCDLTASVFLMLVGFLFLCVFLYTNLPVRVNKLYSFLFTVLEGLIMLIFLSRDLFNIYVAIEVSAICCGVLIMFKRESRSIYDGLIYLLTNITGMLFFLLGIGLVYRQCGVLDFDGLAAAAAYRTPQELLLAYVFLMTGVCMKCALFPMHFWLPAAHGTPGAPTAVSAILSGLYIKSGVYLFIRLQAVFSPVFDMDAFFFWAGVVTALAGIVMAVCQCDIKLILAYHTISQVGLIIAGLSTYNPVSRFGAMLHIINHALFKSLLFLAAGLLITAYGTRNVYKIRGVMKSMPAAGMAVLAGILGITGAPFFNGSISKYMLSKTDNSVVDFCFLIINFGTILSFVKFGNMLFGEKKELTYTRNFFSTLVLALLSLLCLATGLFAGPFLSLFFQMDFSVGLSGYLVKSLIWAGSFLLAILFYKKILSKIKRLKSGIDFSLDMNHIALCTGAGFLLILGAGFLSLLRG